MDQSERLAEVSEADATGRTAEIYAAFRAATGLPLVNLVWRHMAAGPGVLEWAWASLAPAFSSGALNAAARRACAEIADAGLGVAHDIDREALAAAVSVFAVYNHSNPINLVALQVLVRLLAGETQASPAAGTPAAPPPDVRLPEFAGEIDDRTARRMDALARLINGREAALMPTVLRHLARWPALLDALQQPIEAFVQTGAVDEGAADLLARAAAEAASIPVGAVVGGRPSPEISQSLDAAIQTFLPSIARMVVIGHALAPALASAREAR